MGAPSRRAHAGNAIRQMHILCTDAKLKSESREVLLEYVQMLEKYFQGFSDAHNEILESIESEQDCAAQAGISVGIQMV